MGAYYYKDKDGNFHKMESSGPGLDAALLKRMEELERRFNNVAPRLLDYAFTRYPNPAEGWEPLTGCIIEDGATRYPEAWAKLQTSEGQQFCISAADRETLKNKSYYTLADGSQIGFNGIGGVGFFTLDTATGVITMPDIRGQFFGAAGAGSLNVWSDVGESDIDRIRDIYGHAGHISGTPAGAFQGDMSGNVHPQLVSGFDYYGNLNFYSGNVVPSGPITQPPRISMLACAYMGQPAG